MGGRIRCALVVLLLFCMCQLSLAQKTDYQVEDAFYQCLTESLKMNGVDVKVWQHALENLLISDGVLKDTSGKNYRLFFKDIVSSSSADELHNDVLQGLKIIGALPPYKCYLANIQVDRNILLRSKFYAIELGQISLDTVEDVTTEMVGEIVLSQLTDADFSHDLYKTLCLIYLINWHLDIEESEAFNVSPDLITSQSKASKDSLFVFVNEQNEIFLNHKKVKKEKVTKLVNKHLSKSVKKGEKDSLPFVGNCLKSEVVLVFTNNKETSYEAYLAVYELIKKAYDQQRQSLSRQYLKQDYALLHPEQQKILRQIMPFDVSENAN